MHTWPRPRAAESTAGAPSRGRREEYANEARRRRRRRRRTTSISETSAVHDAATKRPMFAWRRGEGEKTSSAHIYRALLDHALARLLPGPTSIFTLVLRSL